MWPGRTARGRGVTQQGVLGGAEPPEEEEEGPEGGGVRGLPGGAEHH